MSQSILIDPEKDAERQKAAADEKEQQASAGEDSDGANADDSIPEKYRGKSPEEIIEMHVNAERELGRARNEVGHYRNLVQDLAQIKRQEDLGQAGKEDDDFKVTSDSLLDDPQGSITKIVQAALQKELGPVKQQLDQTRASTAEEKFVQQYGTVAEAAAQDPRFQDWVTASEVRLKDAMAARDGDLDAAARVLDAWNDRQELLKELAKGPDDGDDSQSSAASASAGKPKGREGARRASTGGDGNADSSRPGKPVWRKDEVMDVLMNNPDKYYSESYQRAMKEAIQEGRYVE